jgi:hypothetical protein
VATGQLGQWPPEPVGEFLGGGAGRVPARFPSGGRDDPVGVCAEQVDIRPYGGI